MAEQKRRGRPRGSGKKAVEQQVEAPLARNDEHMQALWVRTIVEAEAAEEVLKAARDALKAVMKTAEERGFVPSDVKWALKQRKSDQGKEIATLERRLQQAKWLSLPIGTQVGLFDGIKPTEVETARERGRLAGMEGKACISPYAPGLEQTQAFIEGWHSGQDANRKAFLAHNGAPIVAREAEEKSGDDFDDALFDGAVSVAPLPGFYPEKSALKQPLAVDIDGAIDAVISDALDESGVWEDVKKALFKEEQGAS